MFLKCYCGFNYCMCALLTSISGIAFQVSQFPNGYTLSLHHHTPDACNFQVVIGGLFYVGSGTLFEDIPYNREGEYDRGKIDKAYQQTAYNCWVSAGLFLLTTLACFFRLRCLKAF